MCFPPWVVLCCNQTSKLETSITNGMANIDNLSLSVLIKTRADVFATSNIGDVMSDCCESQIGKSNNTQLKAV